MRIQQKIPNWWQDSVVRFWCQIQMWNRLQCLWMWGEVMKVWKMLWRVSGDRKEMITQIHPDGLHAVTRHSCDQIVCACHRGVASGAAHPFLQQSGWMRTHHWMQGGSGSWPWCQAPPPLITIIILRELPQPEDLVWTETSKTSSCSALLPAQIHLRFSFRRSRDPAKINVYRGTDPTDERHSAETT